MNIYLDNAATTKVSPRVKKEMNKFLSKSYANPSSNHLFGVKIKNSLLEARKIVAISIGAKEKEIIFTSSGTEANNLALKGLFFANFPFKNHIVTSTIEHDSVLNTCKWLEGLGAKVTYLNVDKEGRVDNDELRQSITDKTFIVSVIHGNNEIGTIQDIASLAKICHEKNVLFHSDACQSFTKTPIDIKSQGIDLLTINSHKIHGPKGVGALYIKEGVKLTPLLHGGGQEFGLRSSTENISGIMGFAKAISICRPKKIKKMITLRDYFIKNILKIDNVRLNGPSGNNRLCNNINISFFMVEGELIQSELNKKNIFVSTGSACSSSARHSSHVIKAIQCPMEYLHGNIRISISRYTTKKELDKTLKEIKNIIAKNNLYETSIRTK